MPFYGYILLGAVWVVICLAIGLQVRGGVQGERFIARGLKAMLIFWMIGLCLLVYAISSA